MEILLFIITNTQIHRNVIIRQFWKVILVLILFLYYIYSVFFKYDALSALCFLFFLFLFNYILFSITSGIYFIQFFIQPFI